MKNSTTLPEIYNYSPDEMKSVLAPINIAGFKVGEILKWAYQRKVSEFSQMTTLSKDERTRLEENFDLVSFSVKTSQKSPDGTRKILYELRDGRLVESVLIPDGKRLTLCVSTQVGCPVGCKFCASGLDGLRRNLSTSEIVGQFVESFRQSDRPITNVVIMGMGEPFLNLEAVLKAIQIFNHPQALELGIRRITLSTVGIKGFADKVFDSPIFPRLAISLHAPTDELRQEIIPFAKLMSVEELVDFMNRYLQKSGQRVTVEYVLLDQVNSTTKEAHALGRLLKKLPIKVNLIPYNTVEGIEYLAPSPAAVDKFAAIVSDYGLTTTVRRRNGDHIDAACGQLRLKEINQSKSED